MLAAHLWITQLVGRDLLGGPESRQLHHGNREPCVVPRIIDPKELAGALARVLPGDDGDRPAGLAEDSEGA
ncbi:MAG: hypothetical protein ACRDWN_09045, partial [Acidimicrobiales bacterium]